MNFKQTLEALKQGAKVKLPEWAGYWSWENGSIKMYCKNGDVLDIRETQDVAYTLGNIVREDWEIVGEVEVRDLDIQTFTFGEAIRRLKSGHRVARKGWNGKGMFVVYQKGYPQGIPCNKQTADAWGMREGDTFICNPYLQIKNPNGTHSMWSPSVADCLSTDWVMIE